MTIEIKAPAFPESVADGVVATWYKKVGEQVSRDELIVDIETDKVVIEVLAPANGSLQKIIKGEGETILSGELIASFEEGAGQAGESAAKQPTEAVQNEGSKAGDENTTLSPAVRKLVAELGVDASAIKGTGKGGRLLKEDILNFVKQSAQVSAAPSESPGASQQNTTSLTGLPLSQDPRPERRVPMTRMRARIAERLVDVTQSTAMLTTFNEINMKPLMNLRKKYQDRFVKAHDIKLGYMSLFARATVEALKRYPEVNASIDGPDIVYHGYYDISVAVSTEKGLVVPVIRDADNKTLAELEQQIVDYAQKARVGKLGIEDMMGGTFTITNGGTFGSLLSTPILNAPQTAILGMHAIQERPMAVDGEVVILPMMYVALSYDHRLIDGKDAVGFLVTIKKFLEDPALILLDI